MFAWGDVAARVAVRFDELQGSCRLIHTFLARCQQDHVMPVRVPLTGVVHV